MRKEQVVLNNNSRKIVWFSILLLVQLLGIRVISFYPSLVEKYYSEGIYLLIAKYQRLLWGWIPFSIGDVFYLIVILASLRYLFILKRRLRESKLKVLLYLLKTINLVIFLFYFLWGFNYYRIPLSKKLNLPTTYETEELVGLTQQFITKTNTFYTLLHHQNTHLDDTTPSLDTILELTLKNYKILEKRYPKFAYKYPSAKESLFSLPLTYMGFGGYLNPFTGEAQTNALVPIQRQPTLIAHEIGHQLGYASETDTNFIGFLVSLNSKDLFIQYAAHSHALVYLLNDLSQRDPKTYQQLYENLDPGVIADYKRLQLFWESFQNPIEPFFKSVFNLHLKANRQKEGIESYNQVVGLLIGYYKLSQQNSTP